MKRTFKNYEEIAKHMIESMYHQDDTITYIGHYDKTRCVIEELIRNGKSIMNVEIEEPVIDGYGDEFCVTLDCNGIWCEKAKRENGYISFFDEVFVLVDGECNSLLLKNIKSKIIEVEVGEESDDSINCNTCPDKYECDDSSLKKVPKGNVHLEMDDDGDIHSISVDKNYDNGKYHFYYKSSSAINDDLLDRLLKLF